MADHPGSHNSDTARVPKKGEPDPTKEQTVTVGGKRRAVKEESLVSLVRGAIRSLSPNIKDRRQRIADVVDAGIDDANRASRRKRKT